MKSNAPIINSGQAVATNFDVREQKFSGTQKGIPIAGDYSGVSGWKGSAIGEYKIAPSGQNALFESLSGEPNWKSIPSGGNYVVTVQGGQIVFVEAPAGDLQVFNNNLGWTPTEACED
jgi:hypothetical protein